MTDLQQYQLTTEYELIKAKKSELSAKERAKVVWMYENAKKAGLIKELRD